MKHPLDGIKVVDLAGYIGGAYCASLLADMGADVVKVESPIGDGFRIMSGAFQGWNRGKRSIVLDLTSERGRDILYRMVASADVVTENFRPGTALKLGVDYGTLKRVSPAIIYATVTGYGSDGPGCTRPAFDSLLQAESGANLVQGGEGNAPVFLHMAMSDYGTAVLAAYGVAAALVHRARTGQGQRVETSLLNASIASQAGEFFSYPGKPEPYRAGGLGPTSTRRLYKARDGWFFLSCADDRSWRVLCQAIGREDLLGKYPDEAARLEHDVEIGDILGEIFSTSPRDYWLGILTNAGIKNAPSSVMRKFHDQPQAKHLDLTVDAVSPDVGPVKQMGLPFKLSRTPGKIWGPAPAHGQHTDEVLAELGYSKQETAGLRERGVLG